MEPRRLQVHAADSIEWHDPCRVPKEAALDHQATGFDAIRKAAPLENEDGETHRDEHSEHRQSEAAAPGERDDEDRKDARSDSFTGEDEKASG